MEKIEEMGIAQEVLTKIGYKNCLSTVDGEIYFRHDTEDSDSRKQWDNYIDIVEDLRTIGFMLDDPQIEHDCITGNLKIYKEYNKKENVK